MGRVLSFGEYVLLRESSARRPAAKSLLYPLGYGGLGLYPPQTWLSAAADAVLYITQDERLYNNKDAPPDDIRHIPGHKQYDNPNTGTDEPFSIKHIPGPEPDKRFHTAGEGPPFSITHLKK